MDNTNDHDILIEVKTILKQVVDDFRSYRKENHDIINNLTIRISDIEKNKLDKKDFEKHNEDDCVIHEKWDVRIQRLERGFWIAIGVLAVINILSPLILNRVELLFK